MGLDPNWTGSDLMVEQSELSGLEGPPTSQSYQRISKPRSKNPTVRENLLATISLFRKPRIRDTLGHFNSCPTSPTCSL
jgi:hypothetical protein